MTIFPWQQSVWKKLHQQWREKHLPHALLFVGMRGLGKWQFANAFAARILCENDQAEFACGECRACQLFAAGTHPDFMTVTLEEKERTLKVDAIRALNEKVSFRSARGKPQVVIIYPAEAMNRASANALLKTLEEPPGDTIFILVSHQWGHLPATVLSRCQRVLFSMQQNQEALPWLAEKLQNSEVNLLLRLAENAPLRAVQLSEQNYLPLRDQLIELLLQIKRQEISPISRITELLKNDVELILLALLSINMDVMRLQLQVAAEHVVNQDRLQQLQQLCQKLTLMQVENCLQQLQHARELLTGQANPNMQLLLERYFLSVTD